MLNVRRFLSSRLQDPWLIAGLAMVTLTLAALVLATQGRPAPSYALKITAGDGFGRRHGLAIALAKRAQRNGLILELVTTTGSLDALAAVQEGEADLAMVQGGLYPTATAAVRQVAPLHIEPLHLLVRPSLSLEVARDLGNLEGYRVNLSSVGSGTRALAFEVLRHGGLDPIDEANSSNLGSRCCVATSVSYKELESNDLDTEELPDAVFTVSTIGSPVADHLVQQHGYQLVPIPFAEAFRWIGATDDDDLLDRSAIVPAIIPAHSYGNNHHEPEADIATLGTRLLLIARADLPNEAIERLLQTLAASEFNRLEPTALDERLRNPKLQELPIHDGVTEYLQRDQPLVTQEIKEDLEKAVTIGSPILGCLFLLVQWLRRRSHRARDERLEAYLVQVAEIERRGQAIELSAAPNLDELIGLQQELGTLKQRALLKFEANELNDSELLSAFLTHANAARDYLTRLILHQKS